MKNVLAFDLGASSGRAIAGAYDGSRLTLSELHRFSNDPVMLGNTFYWDFPRLIHEIKTGISKANLTGTAFDSLGVDTWGVDFGLVTKSGRLVDNPVHYRDARNIPMPAEVFAKVPARDIYASTGIQTMDLNTIFQVYYLATRSPELLTAADSLLFTPDLINFFLSGARVSEYSIASTSQLLNARKRTWDTALCDRLGIPTHLLREIVDPGTTVGRLTPAICEELGVQPLDIVATTGHDTAAAVAAVPTDGGDNWAYLSCGTWSLLGLELPEPFINDAAFDANFTNEGGVNHTTRFLKNIIGLWLMQETRRAWIRESGPISFKEIDALTVQAKPLTRFIDPDYPEFARPGQMPEKIAAYLARTGQPAPDFRGDISRLITESLAMKYRVALDDLERLTGRKIDTLHIIGGGVQDTLLCECTANATGRTVVAGPIEATAAGNVLVQLFAAGEFKSIDEARACVKRSFPITVYEPHERALWEDAYGRYRKIIE
ncbi:MAG: rhamnulokinase [Eubacteriales bacterium]|jgi:rhamnulokinase